MICPGCDEFFAPVKRGHLYCSNRCRQRVFQGTPMERPCPGCGVPVPVRRGRPGRCEACKTPPVVWPGLPGVCANCTGPVEGTKEFCSFVCKGQATRRRSERTCERCRLPWRPKKPLGRAQGLCWNCRCDVRSLREVWSGVKESRRRQLVVRCAGRCEDCGGRDGVHAHHVVPQALGGLHDLDNLLWLCESCHQGEGWYRHHAPLVEAGLVVPPSGTQLLLVA